ncbi:MAG: carboxypeptidase-like regulatory domain-containing protein [Desulfarculaceae bacterium]|nr:carboxypeptidase-like regulatory domain-containing protein [Desulfarculaceae bacterium]
MTRRVFLGLVLAWLALAVATAAAPARAGQEASLVVEVSSFRGGYLFGVSARLSGPDRERLGFSDDRGQVRFDSLPPGSYDLELRLRGYRPTYHRSISLRAGESLRIRESMPSLAGPR